MYSTCLFNKDDEVIKNITNITTSDYWCGLRPLIWIDRNKISYPFHCKEGSEWTTASTRTRWQMNVVNLTDALVR